MSARVYGGGLVAALAIGGLTAMMHSASSASAKSAQVVSLIGVVASPEKYDGLRIRVIGVAQIEFEQTVLYVGLQDYDHRVLTNSVGLLLAEPAPSAEQKSHSGKYVGVEGTFRLRRPGTRSIQVGDLESITRFEDWHAPTASQ